MSSFFSKIIDFFLNLFGRKASPPPLPVTSPDWVISNGTLTLKASRRFGSAIYSILWNGIECIDSYDHGRLYQSAWQYDGLGEGYNPTEGGSAADAIGAGSSSQIVSASATADTFAAASKPALWQPHEGTGCSLEKTIVVGAGAGHPNLVSDVRTMVSDADHVSAAVEILTAYLSPAFTLAKSLDVASGVYSDYPLGDNGASSTTPNAIVACNADGSCALGLWSPAPGVTMLGQRIAGIVKTDIWTAISDVKAGERYSWPCFAAVGTLADVAAALKSTFLPFTHP